MSTKTGAAKASGAQIGAGRRQKRAQRGATAVPGPSIAAAPETAVSAEMSRPAGAPGVVPECYNGRHWLLRDLATGRIVAYPGHDLGHVARSWLAYELANDGDQVATLAALEARVQAAEHRIVGYLQTAVLRGLTRDDRG